MITVPGCRYDLDPDTDIPVSKAEMFILIAESWVPAKRIRYDEDSGQMICAVVHWGEHQILTPPSDHWLWDEEFQESYPELYDAAVAGEGGEL